MIMAPLFQLVRYDVFRLFGVFAVAWIVVEIIFFQVESILWSEAFMHWGDVALTAVLGGTFGWCAFQMGKQIIVRFHTTD